jgi:hypothetical protein
VTPKEDLKLVLRAIQIAREKWLILVREKVQELMRREPMIPQTEAFNRALTHSQVNLEFQNLLNLYGIIGASAELYVECLAEKPEQKRVA